MCSHLAPHWQTEPDLGNTALQMGTLQLQWQILTHAHL